MDGAVATFAVEQLGNLLISEGKSLIGVKDQAVDAKQGDERVINSIVEIREVAYEAEDVIETYLLRVASRRRKNVLKRSAGILSEGYWRRKLGSEIKAINIKISDITRSISTYGVNLMNPGEGSSWSYERPRQREPNFRRSYSHVEEEDIVGLEKDVEELAKHLVNSKNHVAIWGMGGLGKTTLARRIYRHHLVRRHFDAFAWTCISQEWQTKDILQGLLISLLSPSPEQRKEIEGKRIEELAKQLHQFQKEKKCLVILDDVWDVKALDSLSSAFPNTRGRSKIVLTTRNKEVASHRGHYSFLHELRFLTEEESWELFRKKALGREAGTDQKENIGREIVTQCGGLPLAIVVIGGLLASKYRLDEWKMVHYSMRGGKGHIQQQDGVVMEVLALSYRNLPYYLKPCFLYFGLFPEDYEINSELLVRKWVAEGFVSPMTYYNEGVEVEETMVDVAKNYLDELVERCMVQVRYTNLSGRVKSCQLHDLMREFCLRKAKDENFLMLVRYRRTYELLGNFSSSSSTVNKSRRLAICSDPNDDVIESSATRGQGKIGQDHLRSFLFFAKIKEEIPLALLLNGLDMVKVLHLEGLRVNKALTREIGNLIHLRYLCLKGYLFIPDINRRNIELPSSIGNLICLQTLELGSKGLGDIFIPDVLWKMGQMRHLYLPRFVTGNTKLRLDNLSKLETLVNFDTRNCDIKCIHKLTNLRKLKVKYITPKRLGVVLTSPNMITSSHSNSKSCCLRHSSFEIYGDTKEEEEQTHLRQLLGVHHLHKLWIFGFLVKLREHLHQFPSELTKFVLEGTKLEEDPMPTLEKLPCLRRLEFWRDSYIGKEMVCSGPTPCLDVGDHNTSIGSSVGGFPQLKYLILVGLPQLEDWRVDEGAMPSLLYLRISFCDNLKQIPDGLRFTTTLKELKIHGMLEAFNNRLREGGEDYYKVQHVPSITLSDPIN